MVELGPNQKGTDKASFGAVVGQTELKRATLAVAANDALDGLLVRGEKGTAKSTVVRSVAELLPTQRAVEDCPYGCPPDAPARQCGSCATREELPVTTRPVPFVTLPLGATRERVTGSLSVADALNGEESFEPGLLARANRGFCYVDEVNLLDDHLVDVLLDAAASGVNTVERDGVSVTHPASFTLVGTMNPEEGELRPQLRDRFAVSVDVTACEAVEDRVAVVARALNDDTSRVAEAKDGDTSAVAGAEPDDTSRVAEADPDESPAVVGDDPARRAHEAPTAATKRRREQLRRARECLPDVQLPESVVAEIAAACRDAGVDGHRGDIAAARTARTLAALDNRRAVTEADAREALGFALPHRLQSRPFENAADPSDALDDRFDDPDDRGAETPQSDDGASADDSDTPTQPTDADGDRDDADGGRNDTDRGRDDADETRPNAPADAENGTDDSANGAENGTDGSANGAENGTDGSTGDAENGTDGSTGDAENGTDGSTGDGENGTDDSTNDADETAAPLMPGAERAGIGDGDAPNVTPPAARAATSEHGSADAPATTDGDGPRLRTTRPDGVPTDVDAGATVRAAAGRNGENPTARDLRQSVRKTDATALVTFVVDASASMRPAMRAAKGTVFDLLRDAYENRDRVAFVAFAGDDADVVLPPTDSVSRAARHLKQLPTGDRTPLPAGLHTATQLVERADPAASLVVLVTDGRANVADSTPANASGDDSPVAATRAAARRVAATESDLLVVDADPDATGVTDVVVHAADGDAVPLEALTADAVDARIANSL